MMKRAGWILVMFLMLLGSGRALAYTPAFTQNEFTTAECLDQGMTQSGIHFTIGKGYKSYYPEIRYGVGGLFELGFKFGFDIISSGDDIAVLLGPDIKYQLVKEAEGVPVSMAVDLGFDNTFIKGKNVSELTFSTIFSRNYPLTERGYKLTPYGGLELSALYGSYLPEKDTSMFVFAGMEWKITQKFMIKLELKTGKETLGGVGVTFEY